MRNESESFSLLIHLIIIWLSFERSDFELVPPIYSRYPLSAASDLSAEIQKQVQQKWNKEQ
jgi:hypothetical protein